MRKVFLLLGIVFIIAVIFGLRWAIKTGHAKHQVVDAEYHVDQDIRTIYHAEREYYVNHELFGFPCNFSTLVAKPDQLLDDKFASGHADGYAFTFSDCKHEENFGFNGNVSYRLIATPEPGSTLPLHTFCVEDDVNNIPRGEVVFEHPPILASAPGSIDCTQPLTEPAR